MHSRIKAFIEKSKRPELKKDTWAGVRVEEYDSILKRAKAIKKRAQQMNPEEQAFFRALNGLLSEVSIKARIHYFERFLDVLVSMREYTPHQREFLIESLERYDSDGLHNRLDHFFDVADAIRSSRSSVIADPENYFKEEPTKKIPKK